jgi:hypothetical protein
MCNVKEGRADFDVSHGQKTVILGIRLKYKVIKRLAFFQFVAAVLLNEKVKGNRSV